MSQQSQKSKENHAVTLNQVSRYQANPTISNQVDKAQVNVDINVNNHIAVDITPQQTTITKRINIFEAIKNKNFDDIYTYVNAKGDVNVKSTEGYTPLMLAIQEGWDTSEIKKMLDKMPGIDLKIFAHYETHVEAKYGKPIDMALKANNTALVKTLVDYVGVITEKESSMKIADSYEAKDEMFKIMASHIDFKILNAYNYPVMMKLISSEQIELIDAIMSQPNNMPLHRINVFAYAANEAKNEMVVDLMIDMKYVTMKDISETMCYLARLDQEVMFKHIMSKVDDWTPISEQLIKNHDNIPGYLKYAEILGIKSQEPGTIYISDVIDFPGADDLRQNNDQIQIDIHLCQTGQCTHVVVDAVLQPQIPKNMDGVII